MKLFVDNLTHVDVSYLDAKRGLVGESWNAGLLLKGQLNQESMICDFGIVKRNAKKWLDDFVDHTLLVPTEMEGLTIKEDGDKLDVRFPHPKGGQFICIAPKQAFCLVEAKTIEPKTLTPWIADHLNGSIPGDIEQLSVALNTELIGGDFYHYSHGLKKHDGNCQRIAHGHRSKIEVLIDGARNPELEKAWSKRWQDIYLGTKDDHVGSPDIDGVEHNHYSYTSAQGEFHLTLPTAACYDIPCDTTVEQIANYIATEYKKGHPENTVTVRAYEGIAKGAIAEYE